MTLSYDERSIYCCKVCGNVPDKFGVIDHGRGCFTQHENGGGMSYVELPRVANVKPEECWSEVPEVFEEQKNQHAAQKRFV